MARVSQVYVSESDWLRASDLSGPVNVTIINQEMTVFEDQSTGKKRDQIVLYFDGWDKKLGLNGLNAATIATLLNDEESEHWVGHTITLYVQKGVKTPSGPKDAIRVMPMLPNTVVQQPPQPIRRPGPGPAPHVATNHIVQRVATGQQRRQEPPLPQGADDYGADYDPLA
jgi:hypothetical protein